MWPFKWKLSACTYARCYLFYKISRNEISKFGRNLLLAKFGSERFNRKCTIQKQVRYLFLAWGNSRYFATPPLFRREVTSEERPQKFHNDDVSLPDLGRAFDWLKQISHAARRIRSTTQILIVIRHQYGISALVPQTSFRGETSDGVARWRLFSVVNVFLACLAQCIAS